MSKAVQKLFTSIAPHYDFLNHFLSFSIDRHWREKAIQSLKGHPVHQVLDLCAGTLDLSVLLLKNFPKAHVTPLDFSLGMLQEGQKKILNNQRLTILCSDAHHLPFPDQSFDTIVCGFGIRNLEHRAQAAQEIRRVLKPGGKLLVLEFFRPDNMVSNLFYKTYGKYILPKLGGFISKNRDAYEYLQNSIFHFMTVEEYIQLLKENGFQTVISFPLSKGIAHRVLAEGK
jgi:ubiquinone/menaquinone biosynthesis methyltransferase